MPQRTFFPYLVVAFFALSLAATTGVLLRFGMLYGMPSWAQNYGAVRHAHSHLMYFGWVTLALMALIWTALPQQTGRLLPRGVHWQMGLTAVMALLSYPAFWQNGYGLTQIGAAHLPLGSMVSTFNGLTWFFFVGLYVKATWRLPVRSLPVQLWDWAIMLLLLASLGAAGLVGTVFTRAENPFLQQMFLHQFLDLFAVGWFNLALLGVIWAHVAETGPLPRWLPSMSLALLLAPTFVLGMSSTLVPDYMFWLVALANAGAAVLLALHLAHLARRHRQWPLLVWLAFGSLAVVVVAAFTLLIPGFWRENATGQLRIFYLHDILLGWVSTMLIALIVGRFVLLGVAWRRVIYALWTVGVIGMLAALLALGAPPLVPIPTILLLQIAAWCSVPVAAAAIGLLVAAIVSYSSTHQLRQP